MNLPENKESSEMTRCSLNFVKCRITFRDAVCRWSLRPALHAGGCLPGRFAPSEEGRRRLMEIGSLTPNVGEASKVSITHIAEDDRAYFTRFRYYVKATRSSAHDTRESDDARCPHPGHS
jgi:hypothetical protein